MSQVVITLAEINQFFSREVDSDEATITAQEAASALKVINAANRFAFLNRIGAYTDIVPDSEGSFIGAPTASSELISPYLMNPIVPDQNQEELVAMYTLARRLEQVAVEPAIVTAIEMNPDIRTATTAVQLVFVAAQINLGRMMLPRSLGVVEDAGYLYSLLDGQPLVGDDRLETYGKHVYLWALILWKAMTYRNVLLNALNSDGDYNTLNEEEKGVYGEILTDPRGYLDGIAELLYSVFWDILKVKRDFIAQGGTNAAVWAKILETEKELSDTIAQQRQEIINEGSSLLDDLTVRAGLVPEDYSTGLALYDMLVTDPFIELQLEANLGSERVFANLEGVPSLGSSQRRTIRRQARRAASRAVGATSTQKKAVLFMAEKFFESVPVVRFFAAAKDMTQFVLKLLLIYKVSVVLIDKLFGGLAQLCEGVCADNQTLCMECIKQSAKTNVATGINKALVYSSVTLAGLIGLRYLAPKLVEMYRGDEDMEAVEASPVEEEPLLLESPDAQT